MNESKNIVRSMERMQADIVDLATCRRISTDADAFQVQILLNTILYMCDDLALEQLPTLQYDVYTVAVMEGFIPLVKELSNIRDHIIFTLAGKEGENHPSTMWGKAIANIAITSPERTRDILQFCSMAKRYTPVETDDSLIAAEKDFFNFNKKLRFSQRESLNPMLIDMVRSEVMRLVDWESVKRVISSDRYWSYGYFSSGSTADCGYDKGRKALALMQETPPTDTYLPASKHWLSYDLYRRGLPLAIIRRVMFQGKTCVTPVPKNYKTSRVVCKEWSVPSWHAHAIDSILREHVDRAHITLDCQDVNRLLSWASSCVGADPDMILGDFIVDQGLSCGIPQEVEDALLGIEQHAHDQEEAILSLPMGIISSFCTYDFSSASDSIREDLFRATFPDWFVTLCDFVRSECLQFSKLQRSVTRQLAWTSGHPLTFVIESILFTAIGLAACEYHNLITGDQVPRLHRSYGDDALGLVEYHETYVDFVTKLGLILNLDKSFYTGHYRESCGVEFLEGKPLDVHYWPRKALLRDFKSLVALCDFQHGIYKYRSASQYVTRAIHSLSVELTGNLMTVSPAGTKCEDLWGEKEYGFQTTHSVPRAHIEHRKLPGGRIGRIIVDDTPMDVHDELHFHLVLHSKKQRGTHITQFLYSEYLANGPLYTYMGGVQVSTPRDVRKENGKDSEFGAEYI